MKYLRLLLALLPAFPLTGSTQEPVAAPERIDVYLLLGQSNMAGRGKVEKIDRQTHPEVLSLNAEGEWVLARDPVHFDKPGIAGVGPGRTFGIEMVEHTDATIGLVPCAIGGTPIASWKPGGTFRLGNRTVHPYDDALARAKKAMETGTLKGVLWHQGESDSNAKLAPAYEENLRAFVAQLRKDLNSPELPIVFAGLAPTYIEDHPEAKIVMAAQEKLASEDEHIVFISGEGLTTKGDRVHLDVKGARELGKRYAVAMVGVAQRGHHTIQTPPLKLKATK